MSAYLGEEPLHTRNSKGLSSYTATVVGANA